MGRFACPVPFRSSISVAVLFLLMWLPLVVSCHRGQQSATSVSESLCFDAFLRTCSDSISLVPRQVRTEALNRMRRCQDSLVAYQYLSVALKTCLVTFDLDSARLLISEIEDYVRRAPASPRLADLLSECLNTKGNVFARTGYMDSATACFYRSGLLLMQGSRTESLPDVLINLADAYNRQGKLDSSAYWYRRALLLCDSLGLVSRRKVPIYYGLAQIYSSLRVFGQCDHYYDLAASYYDQMLPFEKHFYLNNRGTTYYYRGDLLTARDYFLRALDLTDDYPDMLYEVNLSRINLSDCYLGLGQPDSAERYLGLCEPFFRATGVSTALYYLDTQHIQLALLRGNLPEAARFIAHSVTPPDVDPDLIHIRNRYLRRYYRAIGDYRTAYHNLEKDLQLDDSIRNERVRMRIADLTLRYQQDSTLMAHRLLLQEQQTEMFRLRQTRFIGLAFGALALLAALFIYLYNKKKRALLLAQGRRTVSSLRLENIRNRLSPHFIFNILNQLMSGIAPSQRQRLSSLVKLMRRNLELADQLCVTLDEELDFVRTYLELERQALGPAFHFSIDIAPEVCPDRVMLPSMLLQIPVENALKHALKDKDGERLLWIAVSASQEGTDIRITDNGGGYRADSVRRGTGTGMKVIMQTIQILNQKNRQSIDISVHNVSLPSGDTGCEVVYRLPSQYDYQI